VTLGSVSDCYTLYVDTLGVSEDVFWFCDIGFVKAVAANKTAFQKWMNRQSEVRQKKRRS